MFLLWWLCTDNYTQPSWVSYVPCPWLRTVFQPVHFAPLDHRRWKNYRDAVVELYPHCSMFNFQGTPVHLRFNLALVRHPRFVYAVRAVGSSVVQTTRFTAVSHLPGFNWALFTWQGTRIADKHVLYVALCARCTRYALCFLLCKHIITAELMLCKFSSNTIYCVFQLKIAHFCRFEPNILWLK